MKDPAVREKWAKRVERWKDSGLSAKEFAAETGVNSHSLSWWRWQLTRAEVAAPRRRRSGRAGVEKVAPVTFVEMPSPTTFDGLEVILPTAVRICVRPGFDDTTLGRLLDVLGRRP